MNQYQNEDVAWLRLQDTQREAENRRMAAGRSTSTTVGLLRRLFGGAPAQRGSKAPQRSG